MRYSEEAFDKAENELSRRRQEAELEYEDRAAEICSRSPEAAALKRRLETTGIQFFTIVKSGEDVEEKINELKAENLRLQNELGDILEKLTGDRHYLDIRYTCAACGDTGYREGKRCSCFTELLKRYAAEELTVECGIELHDFSEFRTDLYPTESDRGINPREKMEIMLGNCRSYAENFSTDSQSMLFVGKTGLGKTFMSSCIAKTVIGKGFSVIFGSVSEYLRRVENEHFGRSDDNTLSILSSCDLLILDDLGSEFRSPFYESALYDIINTRINARKPMIISTNLSGSELDRCYNERIVSRLMGCFAPIMFFGTDIRQKLRMF